MVDKPLIIPDKVAPLGGGVKMCRIAEVLNRKISNAGSGHFLLKKGTSHDTKGGGGLCNNGKTHCCLPAMFCDEVFNQTVEILSLVHAERVGAPVRISGALFCHSYRLIPAIIVHMSSSVVLKNHDLFIPV